MAFKHAKATRTYFNQYDLSGYLHSATFGATQTTGDVTNFKSNGWRESIPGTLAATGGLAGYQDADFTALDTFLGSGSGILSHCPAGVSVGDLARLALVTSSSLNKSSPVGGVNALTWDVENDGTVHLGQVLNEADEQTNSGAGTGADGGASTSTGWTAHLHVLAVDGGSWVISLADSADNSSFSAVSSSSFAAATGATSERLQSASSTTTLRRYVRYGATRTGGTTGDGITFFLAVARSK